MYTQHAIFPSIFLTDARFWGNPSPDCRGLHCYRSCLLSLYSNPYANFPKNCQDPIPLNTDMTHDSRSPLRRWLGQYSASDPGKYKGLEPICLHSTMLPLYPKYHNDDSQKTQSMNSFSRLNKSVSHVAVIVAGGRGRGRRVFAVYCPWLRQEQEHS